MTNFTQTALTIHSDNNTEDVKLVRGGAGYFSELVHLIRHASKSVYMLTYIFQSDKTGSKIANELINSSARGVKIYIMADGYASSGLNKTFLSELKKSGIEFRFFNPIFHARHFYFGRRMHAKAVVADGETALVGGMNIADRYNDLANSPAWLDYAVKVSGRSARHIEDICRVYYQQEYPFPEKLKLKNKIDVKVCVNDWIYHRDEVSNTYLELLATSKKSMTILCSYFIPGKLVRREIKRAAERGVNIELIMASVSDVPIAKFAERWLYDWLLRHKIRIFEYRPTVLHGKMAVADGKLATIGSYNVNNISAYASVEMNLQIINEQFAKDLLNELGKIKTEDCIEIDKHYHKNHRTVLKQFIRWLSYLLYRFIFIITTFYYKQRN